MIKIDGIYYHTIHLDTQLTLKTLPWTATKLLSLKLQRIEERYL